MVKKSKKKIDKTERLNEFFREAEGYGYPMKQLVRQVKGSSTDLDAFKVRLRDELDRLINQCELVKVIVEGL